MKKILIPIDFSYVSNYAYDLAAKIAVYTNTELHVLYIVPASPDIVFDKKGNVKDCGDQNLTELYQKEATAASQMQEWLVGRNQVTHSRAKIGMIEDDILSYITQYEIDLVVMGTTGAYGTEELLKGSHAGYISLHSPVPVLSIKCNRSNLKMNDLLLVGDFHKVEKMDLKILKDLQAAFNATINLLKINTAKDFEPQRQLISKMEEFAVLNELDQVTCQVYCDEDVERGIINFCEDTGIDFVAIGTHQRGSISRLFKKSISNQIVHHIFQPVLTFPVH